MRWDLLKAGYLTNRLLHGNVLLCFYVCVLIFELLLLLLHLLAHLELLYLLLEQLFMSGLKLLLLIMDNKLSIINDVCLNSGLCILDGIHGRGVYLGSRCYKGLGFVSLVLLLRRLLLGVLRETESLVIFLLRKLLMLFCGCLLLLRCWGWRGGSPGVYLNEAFSEALFKELCQFLIRHLILIQLINPQRTEVLTWPLKAWAICLTWELRHTTLSSTLLKFDLEHDLLFYFFAVVKVKHTRCSAASGCKPLVILLTIRLLLCDWYPLSVLSTLIFLIPRQGACEHGQLGEIFIKEFIDHLLDLFLAVPCVFLA